MGEETEIKLNVSQRSLAKIADAEPIRKHQAAAKRATNIVTVCYDTQKRHLRKNGITLLLRRQGDKFLQTVKADAGAFPRRKEWEFEVGLWCEIVCPSLARATSALSARD